MTLAELIRKAKECGNQFSTWEIPLMRDGLYVKFDFEAEGSNAEGYHINIINYQDGERMNELGNGPWDKNYKPSGTNWMENVVEQPLRELRRMQDELLKDAFREHFGFELTDVKDKENLKHIIVQGEPISSFRYRGETFLYLQEMPDYKVENDKVTFTTLSKKV